MKKRKPEIGDLRVESYSTGGAEETRGTVAAHAASGHPDCTSIYLCTLQSCALPVCTEA